MQDMKQREHKRTFITQTEAARMFDVTPFNAKWRRMRQQPDFPQLHYMTNDPRERGTFKFSEIEDYLNNL